MSWASAVKDRPAQTKADLTRKPSLIPEGFFKPVFECEVIDWAHLVALDFESFYDDDYTLSKLSTSEYIRDPRFEALMVGVKVGNKARIVVPGNKLKAYLKTIPWAFYSLLCHNTQFDGFILSHHYGIVPKRYYCSLSMARALHSNDVGGRLDDVSIFYGGAGKFATGTEDFKGLGFKELFANKQKWKNATTYCGQDVDEMLRIFKAMEPSILVVSQLADARLLPARPRYLASLRRRTTPTRSN